ncbi:MAG: archease [Elusimicrobiota bacterium]
MVPHTADIGLAISGATWEEFFLNAARGLLEVYGASSATGDSAGRAAVVLEAPTPEDLLVDWINELIFVVSSERWLPTDIRVKEAGPSVLRAQAEGPRLDARLAREVKAATYHGLRVGKKSGLWTATVILDI